MNTSIDIRKLGLAFGATGVLLYLGCIIAMCTVGRDGTVRFFNSLLHGLDTSTIIRMQVPAGEAVVGVMETFVLGWLIGACVGGFYNALVKE